MGLGKVLSVLCYHRATSHLLAQSQSSKWVKKSVSRELEISFSLSTFCIRLSELKSWQDAKEGPG